MIPFGEDTQRMAKIRTGQSEYSRQLASLIIPEVMAAVGDIREHRGKQTLYEAIRPDALEGLVEVAKIQSTDMSNRIENISIFSSIATCTASAGTASPGVGRIPTTSSLNGLRVASWSPGSGRPPQPLRPERWKGSARSTACGWSRGSTTRCSSPSSLSSTS